MEKMKRLLFYLLILVNFSTYAQEQAATALEKKLQILRNAYVIPGIAAATYINGNLVEHAVSGIRKVGSGNPISRLDKFHLGSCTKAMTATLAATFVEEGKLLWQSTLSELLPKFQMHPNFHKVTFEMLLAHRSGLTKDPSDELHLELEELDPSIGRRELARIFLTQIPTHEIHTYNYSNIGYIIAGFILEQISGKTWEMLMQERIFIPLEMNTCGFGPTSILKEDNPSQPWGHIKDDYTIEAVHDDNAAFYGPSANVHCSIPDWVKFLNVHMNGFNVNSKFLNQESFDQLHKLYPVDNLEEYTYGGWSRTQRKWAKGDVLTHSGTNTYNYATVWIAPKIKTILVSTANRSHYSGGWATSEAISAMINLFLNPAK